MEEVTIKCSNCGEIIYKAKIEGKIDSSYIKCHNCKSINLICISSKSEFKWTEVVEEIGD